MTDRPADEVAWRRYEQARPRTEVPIDPALYGEYAGCYCMEFGAFLFVAARDGRLFARVAGQSELEIFPESEVRFFMKMLPAQITFHRDASGRVDSLIHHQNGLDIHGQRCDPALAEQAADAVRRRMREKTPLPEGEAVLRQVIAQHQGGVPDFDRMVPPLAALAREQVDMVCDVLRQAGPLKTLSFRGVMPSGSDVYDATFENASMEWGVALLPDGRISGLYFRPAP
jgi:hypothetical protein